MNSKNSKDISSYDTILKESAALITFSGILFGFFSIFQLILLFLFPI
jgi:hypothetical protein